MAKTLFSFNFGVIPVRIVMRGDELWFVCTDVAEALDYRDRPMHRAI